MGILSTVACILASKIQLFFLKSDSDVPLLETNDKRTEISAHVRCAPRTHTGELHTHWRTAHTLENCAKTAEKTAVVRSANAHVHVTKSFGKRKTFFTVLKQWYTAASVLTAGEKPGAPCQNEFTDTQGEGSKQSLDLHVTCSYTYCMRVLCRIWTGKNNNDGASFPLLTVD